METQDKRLNAEVFMLPSFTEGTASVTYETLASGLPVITTQALKDLLSQRLIHRH